MVNEVPKNKSSRSRWSWVSPSDADGRFLPGPSQFPYLFQRRCPVLPPIQGRWRLCPFRVTGLHPPQAHKELGGNPGSDGTLSGP